jgi:chromate reductase, NAD(P)H dehydrogenase (quinone)
MPVPIPATTARVEIAGIAGSVRAASWARSLLRASATRLPDNVGLTIWDGLEAVPPFNEDLESGPVPSAVADLRHVIQSSHALLIATPEYNTSLPGVLKNALDWASRPYGSSVLKRKPVAAVGTSPLPTGGASALSDLQRVLTGIGADVIEADLSVPLVYTRFDAQGQIWDLELASRITELLARVARYAAARGPALACA